MKVLILGLGQYARGSGIASALHFARRKNTEVLVYDFYYTPAMDKNVRRLKKFKNVRFALGARRLDEDEVRQADVIVKHQRLRFDEPEVLLAKKLGKPIESELSIFLAKCLCRVVGVTGTRGKSTTAAMIAAILSAARQWRKVWLCGNILFSPLFDLRKIKKTDIVVLEMSSWQLEGTGLSGVSPSVAVWTNLMTDHLNTYSSLDEYAEAKAQIFRHQKPEDVVFLPFDRSFDEYASEAPGRVVRVNRRKYTLSIPGEHNRMNASFAAAIASELGVKEAIIKRTLKNFKGLPNRLETIAVKRGVTFINDTTATTPDATSAALEALPPKKGRMLHLIFGGADKVLDFDEVTDALSERCDVFIYLLEGTARTKIEKLLKNKHIAYIACANLNQAFGEIKTRLKSGDTVLLSPGCASFGLFKNEFDRGEKFRKLVKTWR